MDPPAAAAPTPADPGAPAHDAFISYSRRDRDFAALLEKALKAYKPPPGLGLPQRTLNVFRDESDFSGTEYYAAIDAQLRQSRKLILLCSPAARASGFIDDEVRRFIQIRGAAHVIALLLAGLPNNEAGPGREQDMAFPQALCDALQMPLATSFVGFDPKVNRLGKDSFEAAWYTLLANLYDISRKEIEERDRKRQARQRRNAWAAALAVILMLSGALVFALISRQEAVEQRQVALAEKTEAQRQRDIAEERRRAALARQLNVAADAALAEGAEGVRRSLLLGIESMRANWTVEAHQALLAHIDLLPRPPLAKRQAHRAAVRALAVSRGGEWIASESEDATVVWDRVAQREIKRLPPTGRGQRRAPCNARCGATQAPRKFAIFALLRATPALTLRAPKPPEPTPCARAESRAWWSAVVRRAQPGQTRHHTDPAHRMDTESRRQRAPALADLGRRWQDLERDLRRQVRQATLSGLRAGFVKPRAAG